MNKSRLLTTFLIAVVILTGLVPYSDAAAQQTKDRNVKFLRKIAKASREISYSAIIHKEYYYTPDSVGVYKKEVIKIDKDNMLQHFTYPEGMSRQVTIKKGDRFFHKQMDSDEIRMRYSYNETNVGEELSDDVYLMKRNYDFIFLRAEKIGNHVADVVKVISKYRDRDWLQIWVGSDNGFIFKLERYDSDDVKIYQEYVQNLVFNPEIDKKLFEIDQEKVSTEGNPSNREFYNNLADLKMIWKDEILIPKFIPSGFVLDRILTSEAENSRGKRSKYIQLHYTDGLSTISLFQRDAKGEKRDLNIGFRYWDNCRIVRILEAKNDVSLTMFSNLPEETVVELFKSLNRKYEEECESK